MDDKSMLEEVELAFPLSDMPVTVTRATPRFIESIELDNDIEEYRGNPINQQTIQAIHRYLPVLSFEGVRWILPYYLRFCLSDEGKKFSRKETASLIFFLCPTPDFSESTKSVLLLLSREQIICLINFLNWCQKDDYWDGIIKEQIFNGIEFLKEIAIHG